MDTLLLDITEACGTITTLWYGMRGFISQGNIVVCKKVDQLWFMIVHNFGLFQYFFTIIPTLVEILIANKSI